MARSRVTTKRGDKGESTTIAGERYLKSHPIFDCCGTVDELRTETVLCRFALLESDAKNAEELSSFLLWLLHIYFLIGSQCSDPLNAHPEYRKADVEPEHLERLEALQAKLEADLDLPKNFIVSASNELAARFDHLCTTARRLERALVRLTEATPDFDSAMLLAFVNRLSDVLFVVARHLEGGTHVTVDYERLNEF